MAKSRKRTRDKSAQVVEPPPAPAAGGDRTASRPDRERIAARAYELCLARGCGGREMDDWLQAERELSQPGRAQGEER